MGIQKSMSKQGLSAATIHHVLSILGRLATFGEEHDYAEGLSIKIKKPKVQNEVEEYLNDGEIKKLMDVLDECEASNIVASLMKVMLYTGRRPSELYKLRWEDVDLEAQSMTLLKTKSGRDLKLPFSNVVKEVLLEIPRVSEEWHKLVVHSID